MTVKLRNTISDLIDEKSNDTNLLAKNLNADGINPFGRIYQGYSDGKILHDGERKIIAGSYSYLGMGDNPQVKAAMQRTIEQFGATSHGSRVLAGSTSIHDELEQEIASLLGNEAAIVFPTGWITNFATLTSMFGPEDTILTDLKNHNSILSGIKSSGAKTIFFNAEKPETLDRALKKATTKNVLVVIDAIFSMDGIIAPLPQILEITKAHGAMLMIDEAHSIGVLGDNGRGICEHFGIDATEIDILMGNVSKAIAGSGGYICGKQELVDYLRNRADGYMFSNAIPASLVSASLESVKIIKSEPEKVQELQKKAEYFRQAVISHGFDPMGADTPIIPVIYPDIPSTIAAVQKFSEKGVFALPAIYPAVSRKTPRIRFCINAGHTYEDLDYIADTLNEISGDLVIDLR